ncbi:MAG: hypothetical protein LC777_11700 [Actinobacteria bacterium]|nr:hypothetical protein [Actinomycetota bacterium]
MEGKRRELMQSGWEALAKADWDGAGSCFEQALQLEEHAEALDGLGRTLHFQGEYARAIELTERAFAVYRQEGRLAEAADRALAGIPARGGQRQHGRRQRLDGARGDPPR